MSISIPIDLVLELQKESPDYSVVKERIVSWFNTVNSENLPSYSQLTNEQKHEIVVWLGKNYSDFAHIFFTRKPSLRGQFHRTLSNKVSYISQHYCEICSGDSPWSIMSFVLPVHSYQSADARIKRAFKRAMRHYFDVMPEGIRYLDRKICLHLVFVLKESRRDKDIDNMSKLVIDGLKNILFSDDKEIVHLSAIKIRKLDPVEYVSVNIRESHLLDNSDVFSEEYFHQFSEPVLDLNDFMEDEDAPDKVVNDQ